MVVGISGVIRSSTFPWAQPDMWSGGELNVAASEAGEFGDAQPGRDGEDE